jgi:hypothetical protein
MIDLFKGTMEKGWLHLVKVEQGIVTTLSWRVSQQVVRRFPASGNGPAGGNERRNGDLRELEGMYGTNSGNDRAISTSRWIGAIGSIKAVGPISAIRLSSVMLSILVTLPPDHYSIALTISTLVGGLYQPVGPHS